MHKAVRGYNFSLLDETYTQNCIDIFRKDYIKRKTSYEKRKKVAGTVYRTSIDMPDHQPLMCITPSNYMDESLDNIIAKLQKDAGYKKMRNA